MEPIKVFAINLEERTDRKKNIVKQFKGRQEFHLTIVDAIRHPVGAVGLWETIKYIIRDLTSVDDEFVLICEDDHTFTKNYTKDLLEKAIAIAQEKQADVLMGGVSWFTDALQVESNLFWVEKFSGFQFTIVFQKFYDQILNVSFTKEDAADYKISVLTENKFFIFPYISTQKEFGYSDVTPKNNLEGRVTTIFKASEKKLKHLNTVAAFYNLNK
jgi:GR25 family glycosyltransferase involved in LPS biosynthesis